MLADLPVFYIAPGQAATQLLDDEAAHLSRSLRMQVGDRLYTTDGQGSYQVQKISSIAKGRVVLQASGSAVAALAQAPSVHLAISTLKATDRMEWMVEKLQEIGVCAQLTLLQLDNTERNFINLDRLRRIAIAGLKQSRSPFLLHVEGPKSLEAWLKSLPQATLYFGYYGPIAPSTMLGPADVKTKVAMAIGPEGDFSITEIALLLQNKAKPTLLGHTRLRAETAAVVAATQIAYLQNLTDELNALDI